MVGLQVMPLMFVYGVKGACPLSCFKCGRKLNHCSSRGQAVNAVCVVGSKANLTSCW